MKTTVIYHSADYDGIFCREIARKFLPDAELIGWNFGDPLIPFPKEGAVYVLDLSPDCLDRDETIHGGNEQKSRLVWIDHHKTSIEKYPNDIRGVRIDGVAACRLTWQWFFHEAGQGENSEGKPWSKDDYVERRVTEPLAVRLAGEYDIWDKRDPDAEVFQYGLRTRKLTDADWDDLLCVKTHSIFSTLIDEGEIAQRYSQATDASTCKSRTWLMEWEGLKFLCVNSARFNSLFFSAKDVPETGHDALLGFCYDGKCWTVSLYHAKHRTDLDLSEIAKRHGGGGHRGACGFTSKTLPFSL